MKAKLDLQSPCLAMGWENRRCRGIIAQWLRQRYHLADTLIPVI
jgi:hypothetical protein